MKYSKYNIIFFSEKYGHLLYNAETNSFAELAEDLFRLLQEMKIGEFDMSELDDELIEELKRAKVLVESENRYLYEKKLKYYLTNFNAVSLGLAIAPTTYCNFNCPYCYEENRRPIFMNEETEKDLITFIKKHENVETVDIIWYGGEPLANFKTIKNILELLSHEAQIKMGAHAIVTNGYLLDEEKSKYFAQHPLNYIQVTIDGNKETHNERRKLTSGEGTYDTIINNIDVFLKYNDNTNVYIRVNIDATNISEFTSLNKTLSDRWLGKKVSVIPAFVSDVSEGCSTNCNLLQREDQAKFYFDLYEKHGLSINFYPELQIGGCGATSLNYYVVGPEGELYKCWNDIGINEKIVGFLNNDLIPQLDVLAQYLAGPTMFEDDICKSCELFPICDGGCQWKRLKNVNEGKKYDLCIEKKDNLNKFLELHYEKRLKKAKV